MGRKGDGAFHALCEEVRKNAILEMQVDNPKPSHSTSLTETPHTPYTQLLHCQHLPQDGKFITGGWRSQEEEEGEEEEDGEEEGEEDEEEEEEESARGRAQNQMVKT